MNSHTAIVVYIGCFLLAILCGFIRGYANQLDKRKRDEQRDMLLWQRELEKRSSELRAREKSLNQR